MYRRHKQVTVLLRTQTGNDAASTTGGVMQKVGQVQSKSIQGDMKSNQQSLKSQKVATPKVPLVKGGLGTMAQMARLLRGKLPK